MGEYSGLREGATDFSAQLVAGPSTGQGVGTELSGQLELDPTPLWASLLVSKLGALSLLHSELCLADMDDQDF